MRGRRPKPEAVKEVLGNPGRRRRKDPPAPLPPALEGEFAPPTYLDDLAREHWASMMPMMRRLGLVRETDLAGFAVYCQAFARWRKANEVLAREGMTYLTESKHGAMQRKRPEVDIAAAAERTVVQFQRELALTTKSRVAAVAVTAGRQLGLPFGDQPAQQQPVAPAKTDDQTDRYFH